MEITPTQRIIRIDQNDACMMPNPVPVVMISQYILVSLSTENTDDFMSCVGLYGKHWERGDKG